VSEDLKPLLRFASALMGDRLKAANARNMLSSYRAFARSLDRRFDCASVCRSN